MTVIIGTSGWQYRDWRGASTRRSCRSGSGWSTTPRTSRRSRATRVLPAARARDVRDVAGADAADFRWAVKASRFLTHIKRLREPGEPVARLMGRAAGLGTLGTILLQLPPTLKADAGLLRDCLAEFPPGTVSRWSRGTTAGGPTRSGPARALRRCAVLGRPRREAVAPLWRTTDWGYLRLHHGFGMGLPAETLQLWADRLADNYGRRGHPRLLQQRPGLRRRGRRRIFAEAVRQAGGTPTRVPTAEQATGAAWPKVAPS